MRSGAPDRAGDDGDFVAGLRVGVMRLARRLHLERTADCLTLSQLSVLGILDHRGPMTIGELAALEQVKPPSMTRTVNHLERAGLVRREAHETDGRQVVVQVTGEARDVVRANRARRDAWLAAHLAELDSAERDVLHQAVPLLERLAQERPTGTAGP